MQHLLTQPISSMTNFLTTANGASTHQPISSMTNYLATASAPSTYQALYNTTAAYTTSASTNLYYSTTYLNTALQPYQPISSMTSYLTTANASSTHQTVNNIPATYTTSANTNL